MRAKLSRLFTISVGALALVLVLAPIFNVVAQVGTNNTGVTPPGGSGGGGGTYTAGQGVGIDGSNVISTTTASSCVPSDGGVTLVIATPCVVRQGNVALTFGSTMTFTPSSGTGVVFIGVQDGTMKAWHDVTASCTNLTCVSGTATPPDDASILVSGVVTAGATASFVDLRLYHRFEQTTSSASVAKSCDPSTGLCSFDVVEAPSAYFGVDAGANDTYAVTATPAPAAYVQGRIYCFDANTANTGAATINFNSLGAKTIKKMNNSVTADLADNDILVGQHVCSIYDGTNMQMLSQIANAPSGGSVSETLVTVQQDMCGKTDVLGQFSMNRVSGYSGSEAASSASETNGRAGCGTKLSTTTSATSFYAYQLSNSASWLTMQSGRTPKLWVKWTAVDTSSTNVVARFQPAGATGAIATTESVGFVYSDATFGDSDIRFQVCAASSCSNTDTNVTMTAGVTYEGKVAQTGAAAWTWTIRSWTGEGAITTNTGNVTSVNPPTEPVGPFALVLTGNTTAKSAIFHQFKVQYETN